MAILLKNEKRIFRISSAPEFETLALEIFRLQYSHNLIYRSWVDALKIRVQDIKTVTDIPFLPIEFFRNFKVVTGPVKKDAKIFLSSSTTSSSPAKHYVNDIEIYRKSFISAFRKFYGAPEDHCILALLPSYLQRGASSLVFMCDELIRQSKHPYSGFFLDDMEDLVKKLKELRETPAKVLLIGVSYALMDLSEKGVRLSDNIMVMETGGMKGRRKELLKPELHEFLKKAFGISRIHSEYGMTELLSQAYSRGEGLFEAPEWMKFFTREIDDPLRLRADSRTGGINVIDLANYNSCSFIATKDLGRIHPDGKLELLGRYDDSDVRGCNLMIEHL